MWPSPPFASCGLNVDLDWGTLTHWCHVCSLVCFVFGPHVAVLKTHSGLCAQESLLGRQLRIQLRSPHARQTPSSLCYHSGPSGSCFVFFLFAKMSIAISSGGHEEILRTGTQRRQSPQAGEAQGLLCTALLSSLGFCRMLPLCCLTGVIIIPPPDFLPSALVWLSRAQLLSWVAS